MKIQCDVCSKDEASVFCTADEAALCNGCDHRVHHANKLASKHQRFSLLRLSTKQNFPLCDVCKERRAYVFCQQDRAILCKDCDIPIHSANEHTKKHTRFLVTGVKLSDSAKLYSAATPPPPPPLIGSNSSSDSNSKASQIPKSLVSEPTSSAASTGLPPIKGGSLVGVVEEDASTSTRSISEYLIETIPGWQVEDFLDSSTVPFGFSKGGDEMFSVFDGEIDGNMYAFSTMEKMGMWVPQAPPPPPPPPPLVYPSQFCEAKDVTNNNIKGSISRSRLGDDNFIVPQISLQSNNTKRPRYLW